MRRKNNTFSFEHWTIWNKSSGTSPLELNGHSQGWELPDFFALLASNPWASIEAQSIAWPSTCAVAELCAHEGPLRNKSIDPSSKRRVCSKTAAKTACLQLSNFGRCLQTFTASQFSFLSLRSLPSKFKGGSLNTYTIYPLRPELVAWEAAATCTAKIRNDAVWTHQNWFSHLSCFRGWCSDVRQRAHLTQLPTIIWYS